MKGFFTIKSKTRYHVVAVDKEGRLKWEDDFHNIVTTVGMNKVVDACFKTGLASPAWYIGLVDGAGQQVFSEGDTIGTHDGWTENEDYTELVRQDFIPGTVDTGTVDNTDSRAVFTISGDGSIAGCFLIDDDAKGATDGVLYGVGAFSGGTRPVEIGDTLRVTTTVSVEA